MPDDSKKIFVTYRRALSTDFVHRLRDHLKARDFDVFVDVQSIPSGKYAATILHQIEARPHFLAILVPGSLQRTTSEDDWYRREVEHALETRRNIIPLMAKGFSFAEEHQKLRRKTLPGRLDELKQYQHLSFIYEYDEQFEVNINVLVKRFLVVPEETTIVPTPKKERGTVQQLTQLADLATANPAGTDWLLPRSLNFAPLPAPKLAGEKPSSGLIERKFTWSTVEGATGYLLQSSWTPAFSEPKDLYAGDKTEFLQLAGFLDPLREDPFGIAGMRSSVLAPLLSGGAIGTRYYRVRATAGLGRRDSPWSNVVKVAPPGQLAAPKLEGAVSRTRRGEGRKLTWTAIEGAAGYVLQSCADQAFAEPTQIYGGPETELSLGVLPPGCENLWANSYHRVKAQAAAGTANSPWSNVVRL